MIDKLELATISDLAQALSWSRDDNSFLQWAGPATPLGMSLEEAWRVLTEAPRQTFAARSVNGKLRGIGQVTFNEPHWGHLARIVIDPHLRGQGVGRDLCFALMQRAEGIDPELIGWTLFVAPRNLNAQGLYASIGFSICDEGLGVSLKMRKLR